MKVISRMIDRFCQKHRNFGIQRLMMYIVFITAGFFVIGGIIFGGNIFALLAFDPTRILRGEVWRLVTWIFIPMTNNIFFFAISLYFYYFIGSTLEREWGTPKFTVYYLFGIFLNVIYGFIMWFSLGLPFLLIPNFINMSMFFAFATLYPDHVVRLFFILPVKVKWLALINAGYFAYSVIEGFVAGQVFVALLPVVAILNYILICGDDLLSYIKPIKIRNSSQVINFNKAAKQAKKDLADKPYRHKCAVCGRTDVDFPDLEFRYCSQCNGYHCFCTDHINNHIHFK